MANSQNTSPKILTDEQIREIALTAGCDPERDDGALVAQLIRLAEQAVLQSPEMQAWKRDAERYHHLVDSWFDNDHSCNFILMNQMPPDAYENKADIDEDIDAAMEVKPS